VELSEHYCYYGRRDESGCGAEGRAAGALRWQGRARGERDSFGLAEGRGQQGLELLVVEFAPPSLLRHIYVVAGPGAEVRAEQLEADLAGEGHAEDREATELRRERRLPSSDDED
jgi:hypothetical protein